MKKRKNTENDFLFETDEDIKNEFGKNGILHPDALTADEILISDTTGISQNSALESLLKKMTDNVDTPDEPKKNPIAETKAETISEPDRKTLLDRCMPYILDDEGNDTSVNSEPLYKLASVAEILKEDSQKTLEKLSKEYGIVFDSIEPKKAVTPVKAPQAEPDPPQKEPEKAETPDIPIISDIDMPDSPFYKAENKPEANEETVTFTPITQNNKKKPKILVSPHTKPIDFTGEILKADGQTKRETDEVKLEKSEFEEYNPENEFVDAESGKKLLKSFAKQKKNGFFAMCGSILLTLSVAFFKLPFMSDIILTYTSTCMIISSAIVLITLIINHKVLLGITKMFTPKANSDIAVSLAAIAVLIYSILGILAGEIILNTQILMLIILSFNAVKEFITASTALRSLKQICNSAPKNSLSLLSDPAITLAMSKGAIEGDCLIAAPQKVTYVKDFMKYSTFGKFLNGKMSIITAVSVILATSFGFLAAAFYNGAVYGFYAAAAVLCLTSPHKKARLNRRAVITLCYLANQNL